jgi:hypothetical protein
MNGAYSTYGIEDMYTEFCWEVVDVDVKMILKWILKRQLEGHGLE